MRSEYAKAIEVRTRWLGCTDVINREEVRYQVMAEGMNEMHSDEEFLRGMNRVYDYILSHGETYYMDGHFCDLVNHAKDSVPSSMEFESSWLISDYGWMYLERPYYVHRPDIEKKAGVRFSKSFCDDYMLPIRAVGWASLEGRHVFCLYTELLGSGSAYLQSAGYVINGKSAQTILDATAKAPPATKSDVQWIFSSMHLMSQRLTVRKSEPVGRAARRRAEREGYTIPNFIEVITLRRKEMDRESETAGKEEVEWQWQWLVRGHWRNQYFPASGSHKPVFIESYVKGPEDKPIKPPSTKIFTAIR